MQWVCEIPLKKKKKILTHDICKNQDCEQTINFINIVKLT